MSYTRKYFVNLSTWDVQHGGAINRNHIIGEYQSIHNAAEVLEEFCIDYIAKKEGCDNRKHIVHIKKSSDYSTLPSGYNLTKTPRESIYQTTCYFKEADGWLFNGKKQKIFTIDIISSSGDGGFAEYDSDFDCWDEMKPVLKNICEFSPPSI